MKLSTKYLCCNKTNDCIKQKLSSKNKYKTYLARKHIKKQYICSFSEKKNFTQTC